MADGPLLSRSRSPHWSTKTMYCCWTSKSANAVMPGGIRWSSCAAAAEAWSIAAKVTLAPSRRSERFISGGRGLHRACALPAVVEADAQDVGAGAVVAAVDVLRRRVAG